MRHHPRNAAQATILAASIVLSLTCTANSDDLLSGQDEWSGELDNAGALSLHSHSTLIAHYDSYHDQIFAICLLNYLTGEKIDLPNLTGFGRENAALAAGGRYVAYDFLRPDPATGDFLPSDIRLYDRQTASLVQLPGLNRAAYEDEDPSLSATGRFIAFYSNRSGNGNIFLYDRSLAKLIGVPGLNSSAKDAEPSISNDARYIAFSSNRSGALKIYLYDRSTGTLVPTPGLQDNPGWDRYSPDLDGTGQFIVFGQNRISLPNPNIALYNRSTQTFASIPGVNSAIEEFAPSLSHDARYIGFERNTEEGDYHPAIRIYDRRTSSFLNVNLQCGVDERGPSLQHDEPAL